MSRASGPRTPAVVTALVVAVLVAGVLPVSGCADDAGGGATTGATTGASTGASAGAEPNPAVPTDRANPVDPCGLLSSADVQTVFAAKVTDVLGSEPSQGRGENLERVCALQGPPENIVITTYVDDPAGNMFQLRTQSARQVGSDGYHEVPGYPLDVAFRGGTELTVRGGPQRKYVVQVSYFPVADGATVSAKIAGTVLSRLPT